METTEKIAFPYLRLNCFFLMPHLAVFGVEKGKHVEVPSIRLAGSEEKVGKNLLSRDREFINKLGDLEDGFPPRRFLAFQVFRNVGCRLEEWASRSPPALNTHSLKITFTVLRSQKTLKP